MAGCTSSEWLRWLTQPPRRYSVPMSRRPPLCPVLSTELSRHPWRRRLSPPRSAACPANRRPELASGCPSSLPFLPLLPTPARRALGPRILESAQCHRCHRPTATHQQLVTAVGQLRGPARTPEGVSCFFRAGPIVARAAPLALPLTPLRTSHVLSKVDLACLLTNDHGPLSICCPFCCPSVHPVGSAVFCPEASPPKSLHLIRCCCGLRFLAA